MRSVVDDRLRRESAQFALRFTCESCVHFAPEARNCVNGFPTDPHRDVDLGSCREVIFCKLFELR
jgi:hypothetical protein